MWTTPSDKLNCVVYTFTFAGTSHFICKHAFNFTRSAHQRRCFLYLYILHINWNAKPVTKPTYIGQTRRNLTQSFREHIQYIINNDRSSYSTKCTWIRNPYRNHDITQANPYDIIAYPLSSTTNPNASPKLQHHTRTTMQRTKLVITTSFRLCPYITAIYQPINTPTLHLYILVQTRPRWRKVAAPMVSNVTDITHCIFRLRFNYIHIDL